MHVVTVNDYLARRDSEWVGQVHRFLGLEVGLVQTVSWALEGCADAAGAGAGAMGCRGGRPAAAAAQAARAWSRLPVPPFLPTTPRRVQRLQTAAHLTTKVRRLPLVPVDRA